MFFYTDCFRNGVFQCALPIGEIAIVHPHLGYRDPEHVTCWQTILRIIRGNKQTMFYIFHNNDRENFFGKHKNVYYIDMDAQSEFVDNPFGFIRENCAITEITAQLIPS